ncbi:MAG: hypothetical protein Kow0099_31680 [Candidatus Abyssubacteria bacterium]
MAHSTTTDGFLDAHLHLYPQKRLSGLIRWMHSFFPDHPVPMDATLDDVLCDLRRHSYTTFVALVYPLVPGESKWLNSFISDLARAIPGMVPFGCVHRDDDSPRVIVEDAIDRLGLAGLKFHPMVQHFDPWDSRLFGVYDVMNERRRPIYIHTGFDEWYGYHLPDHSLEMLLQRYPDITFVFCHMLFPRLERAFALLREYPNLYLDATNVFGTIALFRKTGTDLQGLDIAKVREEIERHCRRIMLGTDHPAGMGSIGTILDEFHEFGLSREAESHIMRTTASTFLKSTCPEFVGGDLV